MLFDGPRFVNNSAGVGGGAIKINHTAFFTDLTPTFVNTKPNLFYGRPDRILLYNNESNISEILRLAKLGDVVGLQALEKRKYNITSAESLNISVLILDNFANIYLPPAGAKVMAENRRLLVGALPDDEILNFENGRAKREDVFFRLDELRVIGVPGLGHEALITYDDEMYALNTTLYIYLQFCRPGYILQNNKCIKCPNGFYTVQLVKDRYADFTCLNCPGNADCIGGNEIKPLLDFWRRDSLSDYIMECPRSGICNQENTGILKSKESANTTLRRLAAGEEFQNESQINTCIEGYHDNVCGECMEGFAALADGSCIRCSGSSYYYFVFFLSFFISVGVQVFLTFTLILGLEDREPEKNNVLLKIFVNHIMFLGMMNGLEFGFDRNVQKAFQFLENVNPVPKDALNFDCFLQGWFDRNDRIYIHKYIYLISPLLLTILSWFLLLLVFMSRQFYYQQKKRKLALRKPSEPEHFKPSNNLNIEKVESPKKKSSVTGLALEKKKSNSPRSKLTKLRKIVLNQDEEQEALSPGTKQRLLEGQSNSTSTPKKKAPIFGPEDIFIEVFDPDEEHRKKVEAEEARKVYVDYSKQKKVILHATFIIVAYDIYPELLTVGFDMLKCIQLDSYSNVKFWSQHPSYECWRGDHAILSFSAAVPILVFWGFGTPFYLLYEAYRTYKQKSQKSSEYKPNVTEEFMDYYKKEFWYWEFVQFAQKYLVLFVSYITAGLSTDSKVAAIIFIFSVFYFVNMKFEPTIFKDINMLESYSYLLTIVTITLANLAQSSEMGQGFKSLMFIFVLVLNGMYGIFWLITFVQSFYHEAIKGTLFYRWIQKKTTKTAIFRLPQHHALIAKRGLFRLNSLLSGNLGETKIEEN
jgi:hypothetical protein